MSLFGIGSGDKKSQVSNVTTETSQVDSSRNLGTNATLLESGSSLVVNDVSENVARDALATSAGVAQTAIGGSTDVAKAAITLATKTTDAAIDTVTDASSNATLAAQNAVSYGRQLAEIGLNAKTSADTGGATAALDTVGKYAALTIAGLAVAAGLFFVFRRRL